MALSRVRRTLVDSSLPWLRTANIDHHSYDVFYELLEHLLGSAGLPGPARELARMADDGAHSPPARASGPGGSAAASDDR